MPIIIPLLYNFTTHGKPLPEEAQFLEALDLSVRALGGWLEGLEARIFMVIFLVM